MQFKRSFQSSSPLSHMRGFGHYDYNARVVEIVVFFTL